MSSDDKSDWVAIAEVARPHGVKGELKLNMYNTYSTLLSSVDEVLVSFPNGETFEVSVDSVRPAGKAVLLKLYSVDDRDRAEDLAGAKIGVRRSDFSPLSDGEFYVCDVIGASVFIKDETTPFGTVIDFLSYPSVDVYVVEADQKRYEVPNTEAYIEQIDLSSRKMILSNIDDVQATFFSSPSGGKNHRRRGRS